MKLNNTFLVVLFALLLVQGNCFGQKKFERESRLSTSDLPQFALDFEAMFTDRQCIKWYLEEGLDRNSIEAKYKRNGQRYSVEFDTLGTMEDVEILMRLKEVPAYTLNNVQRALEQQSDRYKIDKVQIQYTGETSELQSLTLHGKCTSCLVRYELVVRIRKDKKLSSYEYLFREDGTVEKRSEIIIQTSSNLEY